MFPSAVHPPTSFGSPPEFDETVPTACRFRLDSSSHEAPCLFAPSTSRVRRRDGFHATAAVRPQVFATSRRFAPRYALRACFIPLARPGFSLQGLSPRREPSRLVAATLPSCRYSEPGSPCEATCSKLDYKALLSRRVRCVRSAVKRADRPIPSWAFVLSRASFTSAVDRVPTILPSRACLTPVRDGRLGAPQGLVDRRMGRLSRDLQPS